MNKITRALESFRFKLKTGIDTEVLGEVTEHVIHYKDFYISILEGVDDDHTSIGWSHQPPDYFPVREIIEVKL